MQQFADHEHPSVQETAKRLTGEVESDREGVERLFLYVRDDIKFGFTGRWNDLKASEVLDVGVGHCTTKATLLHSLCKVAGIPSRVHFALIDVRIMSGFVPKFAFATMPKSISHCWTEVEIDGDWKRLDSYIIDAQAFAGCRAALKEKGWRQGFGVAPYDGKLSCDFNLDQEGFVQMGSVIGDHGVWDDPDEYFSSDRYVSFNGIQLLGFKMLVGMVNRKIEHLRSI